MCGAKPAQDEKIGSIRFSYTHVRICSFKSSRSSLSLSRSLFLFVERFIEFRFSKCDGIPLELLHWIEFQGKTLWRPWSALYHTRTSRILTLKRVGGRILCSSETQIGRFRCPGNGKCSVGNQRPPRLQLKICRMIMPSKYYLELAPDNNGRSKQVREDDWRERKKTLIREQYCPWKKSEYKNLLNLSSE